jgi:serine protease Do
LSSTGNFTIGNVTATAGSNDDTRKIQISAPVHSGNSGGPVIDQYGNVVAVIQSKQVAFASGDVPQNVNFAIKTSVALSFLDANGVEAPLNARTTDPMDGATLAEKARAFTVQVICR